MTSATVTDAKNELEQAKSRVAELERDEANRRAIEAKARDGRHRQWAEEFVARFPAAEASAHQATNDARTAFEAAVISGDFGAALDSFAEWHRIATIEHELIVTHGSACSLLGYRSNPHTGKTVAGSTFRALASFAQACDQAITRHVNGIHGEVRDARNHALSAWLSGAGPIGDALPAKAEG